MASAPVYVVNLSTSPGVQFTVSAAEYERLQELGLVTALIEVFVPADQVLVLDDLPATPPPIGTVVFNRSAP